MISVIVISFSTASLFIVLSAFSGLKTFGLSFTNKFDPDFVLIELGGNDALRGYSIKLIKSNLENFDNKDLKFSSKSGILKLIIN